MNSVTRFGWFQPNWLVLGFAWLEKICSWLVAGLAGYYIKWIAQALVFFWLFSTKKCWLANLAGFRLGRLVSPKNIWSHCSFHLKNLNQNQCLFDWLPQHGWSQLIVSARLGAPTNTRQNNVFLMRTLRHSIMLVLNSLRLWRLVISKKVLKPTKCL